MRHIRSKPNETLFAWKIPGPKIVVDVVSIVEDVTLEEE